MNPRDKQNELAMYQQQVMMGSGPLLEEFGLGPEKPRESLMSVIDDRLRGRWNWMFIIGGALAFVLAVAGWQSAAPRYVSNAVLQVKSDRPITLDRIHETTFQHFSKFITTQVALIRSRRVLEEAMGNETLKQLSWSRDPDAVGRLEEGLIVESPRNSELIHIGFEAADPKTAQVCANAILHAYYDIYGNVGGEEYTDKVQRLRELAGKHERELRAAREDVQRIISRYQSADLNQIQRDRSAELTQLQGQIEAAQIILDRFEATQNGTMITDHQTTAPPLAALESFDPQLANLREERDTARTEFEIVKQRYRAGSGQYNVAEQRVETAELVFDQHYEKSLERWRLTGGVALPGGMDEHYRNMSADQLRGEIAGLKSRAVAMRGEIQQLISDAQTLDSHRITRDRIQNDLDRTRGRIHGLEVEEDNITTVVTIAQEAFTPHSPYKDSRKKRAAAGLLGGFMVSFGLFYLLGSIDRRAYGSRQLGSENAASPRCLGVLPDLGESLTDPESSEVASHCVHQIRNQIEAYRDPRNGYVMTISSPYQGDGKTSIVMSLGWSYAAAGFRTLVIDCDLVGRSLTRQLGLIGEHGLRDVLNQPQINGHIKKLPVDNLDALPAGVDQRVGPETVRRLDLERLFDEARSRYDMILVDTGPLLGSLESTPVAAAADAVVLSVRRGRSRTRLEECVNKLDTVGANCLGIILNCAVRGDVVRYVSEASLAAAEEARSGEYVDGDGHTSIIRTGPGERNALVTAMEATSRRHEGAPPEVFDRHPE